MFSAKTGVKAGSISIFNSKYSLVQVSMFSAAAKAGVKAGSIINVIIDWAIVF